MGPRRSETGRPGAWTTGLLLCLTMLVLSVAGCTNTVSVTPPRPSRGYSAAHAHSGQQTLQRLVRQLRSGTRRGTIALGTPGSRRLMGSIFDNARALGLRNVSLRYVDQHDAALTAPERSRLGRNAWAAPVEVSYRLTGYDPSVTHMQTSFVFDGTRAGARIAAVGGHGDRTPSWLLGPLTVVRSPHTLVVASSPTQARRFAPMARRAVRDVHRVLPHWHGALVVEVPASEQQMDQMLLASPSEYADIAAVTTTVTGAVVPSTPVHVFVNPRVFATLTRRGAQVVLSHEATHVATKAAFADMPTWLLEGFADYVALDHAGVGVRVAARQILARIRQEGPPHRLPSAKDLSPTANGLGATYQEAWLACRYLAQRYGQDQLVRFYDAVDAGQTTRQAFRSELGTAQDAFVRAWRTDLDELAR